MKKILPILIIFVALGLIGYGVWNAQFKPASDSKEQKRILIEKGEALSEIAKTLKTDGLIRSELAFTLYVNQKGISNKLQAGTYRISPSMTLDQIIETLSGKPEEGWVTIPEGLRVEEVAKRLEETFEIDQKEFLNLAEEGYMFPDTYLFPSEVTAEMIANKMRDTFDEKYTLELQAKIKAKGLTPQEGVILASLVEREGRSDKVRTEVASIMLKRLEIGMKLDLDATVQYAKDTQNLKSGNVTKFWNPISRADYTEVKSDYNTYLTPGLPPGPIANPSMSAINAVVNAHDTQYLYYYHDAAGNSYYAETLDEHNENVANHR